jgi:hypothetical protein
MWYIDQFKSHFLTILRITDTVENSFSHACNSNVVEMEIGNIGHGRSKRPQVSTLEAKQMVWMHTEVRYREAGNRNVTLYT